MISNDTDDDNSDCEICQICFIESYSINNYSYTCKFCKKNICEDCLNSYIDNTGSIMMCGCNNYIFISKLNKNLKNYEKYKNIFIKQIELKNFDQISSNININLLIEDIRRKRFDILVTFPICVQKTIKACYSKDLNDLKKKFQKNIKIDYTNICNVDWCSGIVNEGVCQTCKTEHCLLCKKSKDENGSHSCDENDLKSLKFIDNTLYKCPSCKLPIEKSSGCSYLTCAACETKFNHTTGNITEHGGHSQIINVKTKNTELIQKIMKKLKNNQVEKLNKILNMKKPNTKKIIDFFTRGDIDEALNYYEKYLVLNKKYDENIKLIKIIYKYANDNDVNKIEKLL